MNLALCQYKLQIIFIYQPDLIQLKIKELQLTCLFNGYIIFYVFCTFTLEICLSVIHNLPSYSIDTNLYVN